MTAQQRAGFRASRRTVLSAAAGLVVAARQGHNATAQSSLEWRVLSADNGPSARWDHTLAADDDGRQLLVFGGRSGDLAALGDTWLYSFADRTWTPVEGAGPAPRFGHAVAVDHAARRMLLFGGQSADTFYNDSWAFDFSTLTWQQIDDGSSLAPSPRYGLAAALDANNLLLISHGFTFEGRFNDTWAFDATSATWAEVSPSAEGVRPLNRCLHEQAWDPITSTMLLYGGCSSGFGPCPQGDTWRFDPTTRTWIEVTPPDGPEARTNPALVYDRTGERMILIGGSTSSGTAIDVWEGTDVEGTFGWRALDVSGEAPFGRSSHDAVMHRGDVYLFGGTSDAGALSDLWKLSIER